MDEAGAELCALPASRGVQAQSEDTNSARPLACSRERFTILARAASSVRFAYDTPYRGRIPANSMPVSAYVGLNGGVQAHRHEAREFQVRRCLDRGDQAGF